MQESLHSSTSLEMFLQWWGQRVGREANAFASLSWILPVLCSGLPHLCIYIFAHMHMRIYYIWGWFCPLCWNHDSKYGFDMFSVIVTIIRVDNRSSQRTVAQNKDSIYFVLKSEIWAWQVQLISAPCGVSWSSSKAGSGIIWRLTQRETAESRLPVWPSLEILGCHFC